MSEGKERQYNKQNKHIDYIMYGDMLDDERPTWWWYNIMWCDTSFFCVIILFAVHAVFHIEHQRTSSVFKAPGIRQSYCLLCNVWGRLFESLLLFAKVFCRSSYLVPGTYM